MKRYVQIADAKDDVSELKSNKGSSSMKSLLNIITIMNANAFVIRR